MPGILVSSLKDKKIDKVIGVESRGFFFGMIAQELNVSCPSENPTSCLTTPFQLPMSWNKDTLEIHTDAIRKGDRVLIHDDVLATEEPRKQYVNWWRNWAVKSS
jgi:adenine phosphoribosyltransferase